MNIKKAIILCALFMVVLSVTSFKKKFKQKIQGTWRENISFFDIRDSNYIKFFYRKDLLRFNNDNTGYREKSKEDSYIVHKKSTKLGYEIKVPFRYTVTHDDIGNLVTIAYGQGELIKLSKNDTSTTKSLALEEINIISNTTEKFYWHIRPDSNDYNNKALQFMQPGTNKIRSFQEPSKKPTKKAPKKRK